MAITLLRRSRDCWTLRGCDDESATWRLSLPSLLDIGERNTLRIHVKLSLGRVRQDLLDSIGEHFTWRNSGSAANGQGSASQCGGWQRD